MLGPGITVLERGWLSSNNIVLQGRSSCALIDTGYVTHAGQTLALVESALGGRGLDVLVNTHLHSDHCGGNAALQERYPALTTFIPPALAEKVRDWDPEALSYAATGQICARFGFDKVLVPGAEIRLGDLDWQVHAAPGHDPHSVILFEAASRLLVSADALWENGFGVVFPELEGVDAFDAVGSTLDLIEALAPRTVIPGHGPAFTNVQAALSRARQRLNGFVADPAKHIRYATKVLLKFKLLEVQSIAWPQLLAWASSTPYFRRIHARHFADVDVSKWLEQLAAELVSSGAARRDGLTLSNL